MYFRSVRFVARIQIVSRNVKLGNNADGFSMAFILIGMLVSCSRLKREPSSATDRLASEYKELIPRLG